MDHYQIVANGFRYLGIGVGIPSLCAALFFLWSWIQLPTLPPPSPPIPGESQSLITVLMTGVRIFGKLAGFLNEIGRALMALLCVVSTAVAGLSAGMYYTGRGLQDHQSWARISGMALALLVLAVSAVVLRRGLFSLFLFASSSYTLWVLWRKFAA